MLDRLTSMAVFVGAADAGSFAAAAGPLGLSPQMVARHVAALEKQLGVRLLNRTTRSQGLTESGRTYYERCRAVLAEVEAADALAGESRAEPHGRLRMLAGRTRYPGGNADARRGCPRRPDCKQRSPWF